HPARPGGRGHRPADRPAGRRPGGGARRRLGHPHGPMSGDPVRARLVLATHNDHKVGELRAILAPVLPGLDPSSVVGARDVGAPEPVEDGVTFVENALIKARALAAFTGLPA